MHQTKKGKEWHFGMKVHIGVDSQTGVVHSMTTTSANVHDLTEFAPVAARLGSLRCGEMLGIRELTRGREPGLGRGVAGGDEARPASGSWSLGALRRCRRSAKRRSELRWSIRSCTSSGTSATPRSATGAVQEHAAADDAAGVCQLDEGRTVPGGVRPCISAPKIRAKGGERPVRAGCRPTITLTTVP